MPDYGHDLRLGAFLTPQSRRPQDVVALAQLSERSGLDLVTFQDHPYQPALLDTWTLLSYVAAAHGADPARAGRPEPSAAPARRRRPRRRVARPAHRRARRHRHRRRRFLGRHRVDGRSSPQPGREHRSARRGDRRHAADVGCRRAGRRPSHGPALPDRRRARRGPEPVHDIPFGSGAYKPRLPGQRDRVLGAERPDEPLAQRGVPDALGQQLDQPPGDYVTGVAVAESYTRRAARLVP